jgi:hypothetical protein
LGKTSERLVGKLLSAPEGEEMFDIPEDVTWKNFNAGVVLLNLTTGNYYTLNESASIIWRALMEGKSESEILMGILAEYNCEEKRAKDDMAEQISFLLSEKLISLR